MERIGKASYSRLRIVLAAMYLVVSSASSYAQIAPAVEIVGEPVEEAASIYPYRVSPSWRPSLPLFEDPNTGHFAELIAVDFSLILPRSESQQHLSWLNTPFIGLGIRFG